MVLTLGTEVPSTPADGLVNTIWVPSIENIQKPTADEINAGTDLSNYVTLGGWSCSPSQDSISDQRENSAQDYAERDAGWAAGTAAPRSQGIPPWRADVAAGAADAAGAAARAPEISVGCWAAAGTDAAGAAA